jgi:hypothetical protein
MADGIDANDGDTSKDKLLALAKAPSNFLPGPHWITDWFHAGSQGHQLWMKVLKEVQRRRSVERNRFMSSQERSIDDFPKSFTFLELPSELRNQIYDLYFESEKVKPSRVPRRDWNWHDPDESDCIDPCNMAHISRHTARSVEDYDLLQEVEDDLVNLSDGGPISNGAFEHYKSYREDWKAYDPSCDHEHHQNPDSIWINRRGNLCANLPMLSLTCKQILSETWDKTFKEDAVLYAEVHRWHFAPLFRFCRTLRSIGIRTVHSQDIRVNIEDVRSAESDLSGQMHHRFLSLFINHWVRGDPLFEMFLTLDQTLQWNRKAILAMDLLYATDCRSSTY